MSRRRTNRRWSVETTTMPQFNRMFMNPVCCPTLSFAHPGPLRYSGPSNGWKKVRAWPKISQTFDLSGFDETQVELALREVSTQVKAAGFEPGKRDRPRQREYYDGLGLNLRFSFKDSDFEGRSTLLFSIFAVNGEGVERDGPFGVRRRLIETPEHSLQELLTDPMSEPRLSVGELGYRTNLLGARYWRFARKPSRVWNFYKFEEDQQTRVLEELLNQAEDAGYEMADMLGPETLPIAQFRGKRVAGRRRQHDVLTISVSQQNVGVELRSR